MIPWWWLLVAVVSTLVLVWFFIGIELRAARSRERNWQSIADETRKGLDEMLVQVRAFQQRAEKAEHLAKVHIEANASFEKQRDDAWKRYHAAGISAGNGQAMLLRSLEGAVMELNKYREADGLDPVKVNEGLRDIVSEFKREHGTRT